jgi:hypothetical protein
VRCNCTITYLHAGLAFSGNDVPVLRDGDAIPKGAERYFSHIWNVIACQDKEKYDYIVKWMAHLVQKPHVKLETILVLLGGQGCGKGYMVQTLAAVIGKTHFAHHIGLHAMTGKFQPEGMPPVVLVHV